jgi:hypothetical protein
LSIAFIALFTRLFAASSLNPGNAFIGIPVFVFISDQPSIIEEDPLSEEIESFTEYPVRLNAVPSFFLGVI